LHPDEYALSIEHTRNLGELEIHDYGIDFSLGKDRFVGCGGILIRGLYDEKEKKIVNKPYVVASIFNKIAQGSNTLRFIAEPTIWTRYFSTQRLNLGSAYSERKKEFCNANYRYLAKDKVIFTHYPDKEKIFKYSDLKDEEIKELLDYNLTR
jgi:hypothetical protein